MKFLDALHSQRLFFDGGTGTLLQAQGLKGGELPETWNLLHPERISALHQAYLAAGSNILCTNTFGANALKFPASGEFDLEALVAAGVRLACEARDADPRPDVFVALDLGPTGKLLKPIITEGEKKAVENCAAACAVYDWLLYVYVLPRTEISKTGVLFESSSQSENIKKAERMKNEALAKIAPLISDSDFVFTCV